MSQGVGHGACLPKTRLASDFMTPEKALKMLKQKYGKNKHIELQEVGS
ncbi:hypothetical protein OUHCRE18_45250 [Enterobacter hormaechei subsp. hoffmannii]